MAAKKKKKAPGKNTAGLICCLVLLLCAVVFAVKSCSLRSGVFWTSDSQQSVQDPLPTNARSAEAFSQQDGRITYPGALQGVDVSSHQGQIDWASVKASGISFAVIQVGYRGYGSGQINADERFAQNIEGALAAGLDVGVYFFSQATSEDEAVEEAEFVLEAVAGYDLAYPIFFDWEQIEGAERTADVTPQDISDFSQAFCKHITQAGYDAGVYFNQIYGYSVMELHELRDYAFWLAEYDDYPSFYYDVKFWQYSGSGTVPGISTVVDLDLYFTD